jgi:sporulation protein YlmC with PRC-barrel domain
MSIMKLSQLPMALAPDAPDLLGWPVYGSDMQLVGTVADLLVETETQEVRYMVIQLTNGLDVPLPIGAASLLEADGQVVARGRDGHALRWLEPMPPDPLDVGREYQLYVTFLPHGSVDYQQPEFLWGGVRSIKVHPLPPKPYENKFVPTPEGRQTNRDPFS